MEQITANMDNQNHEVLFKIDNTRYEISIQLLFIIWGYLFILALFFMTGNSYIKEGKADGYLEFFVSQLTNGRFVSMLIAFLIFIPIFMILEIRKIRKRDNTIYFKQNEIDYKGVHIPIDSIKDVEFCWYCINGGFWKYVLFYIVLGWMSIPFKILEIMMFFWLKLTEKNNLKTLSYKFGIYTDQKLSNGSSILYGYCYDEATLQKLIALKNKLKIGE